MSRLPFQVKLRSFGTIAGLMLASAPLLYALYHHLYKSGHQAEARLMITYLHTLQKVYKQERGSYAYFSPYGAPQRGEDFCEQPLGAAELGFVIYGCHQKGGLPPRYTYRSIEIPREQGQGSTSGYRLEAQAGSDSQKRSLVCFNPVGNELWVSSSIRDIDPMESCW